MNKKVAYWFVIGNIIFDIMSQIVLMILPFDHVVWEIADATNWYINKTWSGTTIAVLFAMLYMVCNGWRRSESLNGVEITMLVIISFTWVIELTVLETLWGQYHWTKWADAIRWALIFMSATFIYDYGDNHGKV